MSVSDRQERKDAGHVLGKADVFRFRHPVAHRDMFSELRWNDAEAEQVD